MREIRIAFYVSRYQDEEIQTPPSLQYLAGYLLAKNFLLKNNLLFADSIDEIIDFQPDIVCIGSVSQTFFDAKNVATRIKQVFPNCFTLVGGYHISALPNELSSEFDVGVIGEGEVTLYELVNLFLNDEHKNIQELAKINGICFRDKTQLIITQKRELLKEIDSQPRPYRQAKPNQKNMYLFSARGCPYQCSFCASQSFWEKYRAYGAKYVVEEIEDIYKRFGITHIYFVDDLFIAPKSRLVQIYKLLKEKNLIGVLSFEGFVRINIIDEEVIFILKEMQFKEIRFGLETASFELLKTIKHQPPKMKKIQRVIELCRKYHLKLCGSLMFGIPGETLEDINITIQFLRDNINDFSINGFYLMQPVPGTQLWDDMRAKNILTDTNFDIASMEIALYKKDFHWENALYLNEENIPLNLFRTIIDKIRDEFIAFKKEIFEDLSLFKELKQNNILIYGTGTLAKQIYPLVCEKNLSICTTKPRSESFFGHKVQSVEALKNNSFDLIFITAQKDSISLYESVIAKTFNLENTKVYVPFFYYIEEKLHRSWRLIEN